MIVKTSPSDNGDCQLQKTFNRLRRKPFPEIYYEYNEFLIQTMREDNLRAIDSTHPKAAAWLESAGWTGSELVRAYNEWLTALWTDMKNYQL